MGKIKLSLIILVSLFLAYCNLDYTYWDGTIVWQGTVDQNSRLFDLFNDTVECVDDMYPILLMDTGYPYVIIVTGAVYNTKYPGTSFVGYCNWVKREIVINKDAKDFQYKHEFIHNITKLGDDNTLFKNLISVCAVEYNPYDNNFMTVTPLTNEN